MRQQGPKSNIRFLSKQDWCGVSSSSPLNLSSPAAKTEDIIWRLSGLPFFKGLRSFCQVNKDVSLAYELYSNLLQRNNCSECPQVLKTTKITDAKWAMLNRVGASVEVPLRVPYLTRRPRSTNSSFWRIKTHSAAHIWQNNQQETEQTPPCLLRSEIAAPAVIKPRSCFLHFCCLNLPQRIVGKEPDALGTACTEPSPVDAGNRKSELPLPPRWDRLQK